MRPLTDAQREVLAAMTLLPAQPVPLTEAGGLALAEPVIAPHDVPPFANSGMDGFAVRSEDTSESAVLEVVEDVPAGSVPTEVVEPGTAIKIMTGAPIPSGADAVIMVEKTEEAGPGKVRLLSAVEPGTALRPAGGDLAAGEVVFERGVRLGPAHLGVLASVGATAPLVHRRPVVAVMSTGDEIMPPETGDLAPGRIRDANRPMLIAHLEELGARVIDLGIIPDDEQRLRAALGEAADRTDAVVTSGGVSMGEYDLVKQVLTDMGRVDFWRVAMQPAKPFAFGFLGETPLFGLPGNPVSVMVALEQFVRPALLTRMGANRVFRPRGRAVMGEGASTNPEKTVFLRVVLDDDDGRWIARLAGGQGSNVLSALAGADAFVVVPVGVGEVDAGAEVSVELFRAQEARTAEEALQ